MFLPTISLFNFVFKYSLNYVSSLTKANRLSINLIIFEKWFYVYILFIKYHSLLFRSMLVDINTFDYNKKIKINDIDVTVNAVMYQFYFSRLNFKFSLISFSSSLKSLPTISDVFLNSKWIERELSEMFNISFLRKCDSRNLLLDYSYIGSPLLKTFPMVGFTELFYNYKKGWPVYIKVILKESSKIEFFYY